MTSLRVVVVAALGLLTGLGFVEAPQMGHETPRVTGLLGPLGVVTSSVFRVPGPVQSEPSGVKGSEDRRAEIRRVADDLFDFKGMARRALGQHWKGLLPPARDEFVGLFTDALEQFFVTIVERCYSANVEFLEEEVVGPYARVHSRITQNPEAGTSSIEYRLFHSGSRWTAYDIVVDGRSLVSHYRSQFNSINPTSFPAQLLDRMRTEQAARTQSRRAVVSSTAHETEPAVEGRAAAGLFFAAALYGRRR